MSRSLLLACLVFGARALAPRSWARAGSLRSVLTMKAAPVAELARDVGAFSRKNQVIKIIASDAERAAVAARLGVDTIGDLVANVTLASQRRDLVVCDGAVRASAEKLSEDASEAPKILLIEGFLLLQDVPIMGLVNAVLFVGADSPTCLQRRLKRSERTEHEREGCKVYYEKCVWPGFLKYTQPELEKLRSGTADGGGVHLHLRELDGEADVHAVAEQAMHALLDRLPGVQANPAAVREAVATAVLRSSTGVS